MNYAALPYVDVFHYNIAKKKKNTFINIATNLIRKVFKFWEADKLMAADKNILKF